MTRGEIKILSVQVLSFIISFSSIGFLSSVFTKGLGFIGPIRFLLCTYKITM